MSFPIKEALNGTTPEESSLNDEAIKNFIEWTKEIDVSKALRELAAELINE